MSSVSSHRQIPLVTEGYLEDLRYLGNKTEEEKMKLVTMQDFENAVPSISNGRSSSIVGNLASGASNAKKKYEG